MKKLHKLLMTTTAIVSVIGGNMNVAQAQSQETYCTASAIGALLGLAITGDDEKAASVIPSECTENKSVTQPRSYQYQYRRNPRQNYYRSNREQLKFRREMDSYWQEQRRLDIESMRKSNCLASSSGC